MAAGLGFKTFNTGDVLSASDVNGYLMQGVLVFADATARDAAITSPQEGQFAYTKNNDSLWYYTGSTWAASGATGDIEGVTAGTGISGGGTSGTVTITNSMATAIDAKGDLIVGTGSDTFSRLAVGSNDYVLTADSTQSTGLKWAAASSGGMVSLASGTLSGSSITFSSINQNYKHLQLVFNNAYGSASAEYYVRLNGFTGTSYQRIRLSGIPAATNGSSGTFINSHNGDNLPNSSARFGGTFTVFNYSLTGQEKYCEFLTSNADSQGPVFICACLIGSQDSNGNPITSLEFYRAGGTWSGGTYTLYGVS